MARKNTLATISSRGTLSVSELHAVARDAALLAATRESGALEKVLESIEHVEATANEVFATTASVHARHEILAAAVALRGAATHLREAIRAIAPS